MTFKFPTTLILSILFLFALIACFSSLIQTRIGHDSTAFEPTSKKYYELKYKNYDKYSLPWCNAKAWDETVKVNTWSNSIDVWAKIVDVYDGDTFFAIFEMFQQPACMYAIRLIDIDAPELDSKNCNERIKAYESKKVVEDMILDKIVHLKLYGSDIYARILGDVYDDDDMSLNEYLIQNKYCRGLNFFAFPPWAPTWRLSLGLLFAATCMNSVIYLQK